MLRTKLLAALSRDDDFPSNLAQAGEVVCINDPPVVKGNLCTMCRSRAAGDQDVLSCEDRITAAVLDSECVSIEKRALP
jgi:hypothetical protein